MRLMNHVRLALGLPFKPENYGGGLTLLEPAPRNEREWQAREAKRAQHCEICGAPPTHFKRLPPWPGTAYSHTTYVCDAHLSYIHGRSWGRAGGGEWEESGPSHHPDDCETSDCHGPHSSCICGGRYGSCGCPSEALAQQSIAWMNQAVYGEVASR